MCLDFWVISISVMATLLATLRSSLVFHFIRNLVFCFSTVTISTTDEVIATQRRCYEILTLVPKKFTTLL